MFSEETVNFFRTLVLDTMKTREEKNIERPDMIHLLMEAKKGMIVSFDVCRTKHSYLIINNNNPKLT